MSKTFEPIFVKPPPKPTGLPPYSGVEDKNAIDPYIAERRALEAKLFACRMRELAIVEAQARILKMLLLPCPNRAGRLAAKLTRLGKQHSETAKEGEAIRKQLRELTWQLHHRRRFDHADK